MREWRIQQPNYIHTWRKNEIRDRIISTASWNPTQQMVPLILLQQTTRHGADDDDDNGYDSDNDILPFDVPSLQDHSTIPRTDDNRDVLSHIRYVDKSLRRWTGRGVFERMGLGTTDSSTTRTTSSSSDENDDDSELQRYYEKIYLDNRYVLITHGTESDPIYNFANRAALTAFWRSYSSMIQLPSARSVVLQSKDESRRIQLMKSVTENNYVENATGVRIRDDGRFVKLVDAVVWNCFDDDDTYIGQAAFFDRLQCPVLDSLLGDEQ
jgi:MEKHLA domain